MWGDDRSRRPRQDVVDGGDSRRCIAETGGARSRLRQIDKAPEAKESGIYLGEGACGVPDQEPSLAQVDFPGMPIREET